MIYVIADSASCRLFFPSHKYHFLYFMPEHDIITTPAAEAREVPRRRRAMPRPIEVAYKCCSTAGSRFLTPQHTSKAFPATLSFHLKAHGLIFSFQHTMQVRAEAMIAGARCMPIGATPLCRYRARMIFAFRRRRATISSSATPSYRRYYLAPPHRLQRVGARA